MDAARHDLVTYYYPVGRILNHRLKARPLLYRRSLLWRVCFAVPRIVV